MHAVVNQLTFAEPFDASLFRAAEAELVPRMREIAGFAGVQVIQTSETSAVLIISADEPQTLDRIATEVGSPWMREHVVPHLAWPPDRQLGPVLLSAPA